MLTAEAKLSRVLGISRNELRRLRMAHLTEGEDWILEKRRVMWTFAAVEKIRALLTLPAVITAPVGPCAVAQTLPEPVTLLVYKPKLVNKKLILCYVPGSDPLDAKNVVRVRVQSSENFACFVHGKPMAIKARHIQADYYELVGRCPRRRGWTQPV
jgi:hypothetical protein